MRKAWLVLSVITVGSANNTPNIIAILKRRRIQVCVMKICGAVESNHPEWPRVRARQLCGVSASSAIRAGGSQKKMLMLKWLRVLLEDAERYLDIDRLIRHNDAAIQCTSIFHQY